MKSVFIPIIAIFFSLYTPLRIKAQRINWKVVETQNTVQGRSECGLAALGGKLYLIGGDGPVMPVQEFDIKTGEWKEKAMAPVKLHHFQAVTHGSRIYVLDAFYEGNFPNQIPAPNIYVYNTITDKWGILKGLSPERRRAGAGATTYNGKLYLVNGISHGHSSGTNNFFDEFDPKTDTWTSLPNTPHIRDHSLAVVVKDKLYAIGGRNTSFKDPSGKTNFFSQVILDVDCFDFKTQTWSTLKARLPQGTGGGTAVVIHGIIYYIGGERATDTKPNSPQKDVYFLDPERSNSWRKGPSLNFARNGVGGAVIGDNIYIAGGAGGGMPWTGNIPPPKPGDTTKRSISSLPSGPQPGNPGPDPGIALESLEVK